MNELRVQNLHHKCDWKTKSQSVLLTEENAIYYIYYTIIHVLLQHTLQSYLLSKSRKPRIRKLCELYTTMSSFTIQAEHSFLCNHNK